MYTELLIPEEVSEIYDKINGNDNVLQLDEFSDFLKDYQKVEISNDKLREMIKDFEKETEDLPDHELTIGLYGFAQYIRSADIIDQDIFLKHQDSLKQLFLQTVTLDLKIFSSCKIKKSPYGIRTYDRLRQRFKTLSVTPQQFECMEYY